MGGQVLVRDLGTADLESLLSLYRHLHEIDDPLPAGDQVQRIWAAVTSDSNQIYLGGFVDGRLVSACNAAIVPNLTRGARPYAVIENVVTESSYRRQGIGSRVMRRLIARCFDRDCYKVMLMSGFGRAEIHAFYEALGFDKNAKQAFVMKADVKPREVD